MDKDRRKGTNNERSMALLGENIRGNLLHILTLAAAFSLVLTSPATAPTEPSPGVIANTTILPGPGDKYCGKQPLGGLIYSSLFSQD